MQIPKFKEPQLHNYMEIFNYVYKKKQKEQEKTNKMRQTCKFGLSALNYLKFAKSMSFSIKKSLKIR